MRRTSLTSQLAEVVILLVGFCAQLPAMTTDSSLRPNILFILTEDQGAHLSLLGTPGLRTPHMDKLVKRGCYFSSAYVAYPVCSASKAAIYTGLHNHTNGILNNTHNYHKPADQLTIEERSRELYLSNRIRPHITTLIEHLRDGGYYQGVTHKLHVAPVEKFPYDEFLKGSEQDIESFLARAAIARKPWFLMVNIPNSHRPYPNSDRVPIRAQPNEIQLPEFLPDTPEVRKDWSEYLAAIETADKLVGQAMKVLDESGQSDNTIILFMGDHGPAFQHGKMTLYDLGLRVPLAICGPGIRRDIRRHEPVCELDLLPTLCDMLGLGLPKNSPLPHGRSLVPYFRGSLPSDARHRIIVSEISNRGPLPNEGIQERSVFDGRWKLIYRERVNDRWRQVNDDSRNRQRWGNRTYQETIRVREIFPEPYRILREMDPQNLGGDLPRLELYDLHVDPDEVRNLAENVDFSTVRMRLMEELRRWVLATEDLSITEIETMLDGTER